MGGGGGGGGGGVVCTGLLSWGLLIEITHASMQRDLGAKLWVLGRQIKCMDSTWD